MATPFKVQAADLSLDIPGTERISSIIVTTQTANLEDAGTDANVYFKIGGRAFPLDKPDYDDHEAGDTDAYQHPVSMSMDELRKARIELGHDNTGDQPGWYVRDVVLEVRLGSASLLRTYKRWGAIGWLAKDEGMGVTAVELQPGVEIG